MITLVAALIMSMLFPFAAEDIYQQKADTIFICSLVKDGVDCDEYWLIFFVYGEVDNICGEGSAGCAFETIKIIFMEDKPDLRDECGRGVLHHELLHFFYPVANEFEYNIVHDKEVCVTWW